MSVMSIEYMKEAIKEAECALKLEEVPIGAVIVRGDEIIGRGHNLVVTSGDPTEHAEIRAIKAASRATGGERLSDCVMYVTLEPCAMCAGAIVLARLGKVVIGARDPKTGACGTLFNIIQADGLNHRAEVEFGVMEAECSAMLKEFFKKLRQRGPQHEKKE